MKGDKELPEGQLAIYEYIKKYIDEHGYSPSYTEIQLAVGHEGTYSVRKQCEALAKKGFVKLGPKGTARTMRIAK